MVLKSLHTRLNQTPASFDDILPRLSQSGEAWYSTTQIPALLQVNAEARYEALKHYSLSFGIGGAQPRVYFDFIRDTAFFPDTELKTDCKPLWARTRDFDKVQCLAIVPEGAFRALQWSKRGLRSLRKLTFVHDTETTRLGSLPHLLEDNIPQLTPQRTTKTSSHQAPPCQDEGPAQKRIQEARDEFNTLLMVLPAQWEKPPVLSTAVFKTT